MREASHSRRQEWLGLLVNLFCLVLVKKEKYLSLPRDSSNPALSFLRFKLDRAVSLHKINYVNHCFLGVM